MKPRLAVLLLLTMAPALFAQTDVIRGRVTGPDSLPVDGVTVRATSYLGSVTKTTRTDAKGRFTIIFINGEGDYWLDFLKLGLAPKRFEIKKVGDEEIMIADTRMTSTIAALDAVNVVGQRNRALPSRNASSADVGGGDRPLTNNAVAPDQAGNLAAMAAAVAGIQLIPGLDGATDMYSALGLSGDQNNVTFNGLGSGVSALPPDIFASTSIKPYPFDPAYGGFSGAQISIQTLAGSNYSRRSMASVDIAPQLQWADEIAIAQGQKYTNLRLGGNALGPIATDRAFYNAAYNIGRRFGDAQTLLNTSALGLAAAGVSPDSVVRLENILGRRGVSRAIAGVPNTQAQTVAQGAVNIDLIPSASGTGHSLTFGALGSYQRTQPVSRGSLLLSTPAHSGDALNWGANLSVLHANYFGFGILTKTTLGFAASRSSSEPYEQLPEGTVRVSSLLPDGSASVKSLLFGGNSVASSLSTKTTQLSNQLSWYSADNRHTLKLTSSLSYDAFTSDVSPSLLGTFSFNSLADLDADTPSAFTRTLSKNTRFGDQLRAAASIGDYWRPSPSLQVQYGARLDANRFLTTPASNNDVVRTFGVRNDVLPSDVYLSPRVGLQWYYGSSPQIAYAPGAARPPRAVVHAGVGLFQNMASSQLASQALSSTGLANSTQTIACVGAAVPFPAWSSFLTDPASIPTQCADGSTGGSFSTSAPNVSLFDSRFRQAQSLRAAADWSSPVLDNRFVLGIQGIVSSGRSQPGLVDLNFRPASQFLLGNESGRPVFADPNAIVAASGAISPLASRVSPAFQHVWAQRSDWLVDTRQVTINISPVTASARLKWDFTYTLLDAREKFNGFSSTAANPLDATWGQRLQAGRHQLTLVWRDFPIFDVAYLTAGIQVLSGEKYTPMVAGDINGDGALNDRAYIFNPASSGDSLLGAGLRALLANGTASARKCLARQVDHLASRGSCQAPWQTQGGLSLRFNPQKIGLPKRASIDFSLQNPLALADLALHGSNDLHGWGQAISPDQNLLFVRGFDLANRQFKYEVNQRFGSTRPQQSATRALPYLSLRISVDIGAPRERQLLTRRIDMGRVGSGDKQSAEFMKNLGTSTIPNPMAMLLAESDSLRLTRVQADSLATLSRKFSVFTDSIWTPAANYFAGLPEVYSHGEAYARYVSARERTVDYLLTLAPAAKAVLTPSQRRRIPPQLANFLDERVLKYLRSSSAGDGGGVMMR